MEQIDITRDLRNLELAIMKKDESKASKLLKKYVNHKDVLGIKERAVVFLKKAIRNLLDNVVVTICEVWPHSCESLMKTLIIMYIKDAKYEAVVFKVLARTTFKCKQIFIYLCLDEFYNEYKRLEEPVTWLIERDVDKKKIIVESTLCYIYMYRGSSRSGCDSQVYDMQKKLAEIWKYYPFDKEDIIKFGQINGFVSFSRQIVPIFYKYHNEYLFTLVRIVKNRKFLFSAKITDPIRGHIIMMF